MPWLKRSIGQVVCQLSRMLLPRQIKRDKTLQGQIDKDAAGITFYDTSASLECCIIRRVIHKLNIKVQVRDVGRHYHYCVEVLEGGEGRLPCIRIETPREEAQWIYGRQAVQAYLEERFSGRNILNLPQIATE